jgi:type IV pilus assembly protein PilF
MKRFLPLAAVLVLAACASGPSPQKPSAETGTIVGEVGDPRNRARVHTELAAAYFERGAMGVALEELRVAAAADPSYATAHSMFGLVYMELKENQLAQASFERALQLSPNDPDINHNFGWFLCNSGREKDSVRYFLQAVRNPLYPTPWRSYSAAGLCTIRAGNLAEAERLLQQALKIEPDDPVALLQMGQIRYRQGSFEEARRFVARFNRMVVPTAESLWLATRIERKLGERVAEASFASQLRRRFPNSSEFQSLQRGEYD